MHALTTGLAISTTLIPQISAQDDVLQSLSILFQHPDLDDLPGHIEPLIPFTWESTVPPRYEAFYSKRFVQSLDPITSANIQGQMEIDLMLAESVPLLEFDIEKTVGLNVAEIRLGERIAQQSTSVVHAIADDPERVIKYQVNCNYLDSIHPLLSDFWFTFHLQDTGLVPEIHYISPPAKFEFKRTIKTDFTTYGLKRKDCADHPQSHVRYMISSRIHSTMWDTIRAQSLSIRSVMGILIQTIEGLRAIHDLGVIHGDIHPGNVVFMNESRSKIGFIDFGRSYMDESRKHFPDRVRRRLKNIHVWSSSYEMMGFRTSFRDDVFRAIFMGSVLLNRGAFSNHFKNLGSDGEAILKFKTEEFLFSIPGGPDRFDVYPFESEAQRAEVKIRLQTVLDLVRNVKGVTDRPPYEAILNELSRVHSLFP